ncbi:hypothetical protein BVRB_5g109480 [Beta vulgaris subsp. vulgaris]|nr:hypothetical protein BVRB_5g109480 [Beta vulgaris subsp. vulgaris]
MVLSRGSRTRRVYGGAERKSGAAAGVCGSHGAELRKKGTKYEPVAEQYAVSAWRSLNRLPLFPKVAELVVPTATLCSDKYNQTVKIGAEKGYRVANYMPLVPIEMIAKVFDAQEDKIEYVAVNGNGTVVPVAAH